MNFPPQTSFFVFNQFIDMRCGHNSISFLVTHKMKDDLLSGSIFIFINKNRKSLKAIYWDGNGLVIVHKKIERGRFFSATELKSVTQLNANEFNLIFNGGMIPLSKSGQKIVLKV